MHEDSVSVIEVYWNPTLSRKSSQDGDDEECRHGNYVHGLTEHPLYRIWGGIKGRCYYKCSRAYRSHGGRGIRVCQEWLESFPAFFDWAIANGWKRGLDLGRIDNDGDYSPDNCRFETRSQNNRNKRSNRLETIGDETACVVEWAERFDIKPSMIYYRLKKGIPLEDIIRSLNPEQFEREFGKRKRKRSSKAKKKAAEDKRGDRPITFRGETLYISEWADRLGFEYTLIRDRIRRGWPIERALTTSTGGRAGDCDPNRAAVRQTDVDQPTQPAQPADNQPDSQPGSQPTEPPRDLFA